MERGQVDRLNAVRSGRDSAAVEASLAKLREAAAHEGANLMPLLIACTRTDASEGEIVDALQDVFGRYTESPVF
jgi:methylmalonyl-CoA mutase N-terminal domain/subunit